MNFWDKWKKKVHRVRTLCIQTYQNQELLYCLNFACLLIVKYYYLIRFVDLQSSFLRTFINTFFSIEVKFVVQWACINYMFSECCLFGILFLIPDIILVRLTTITEVPKNPKKTALTKHVVEKKCWKKFVKKELWRYTKRIR